ncbi:MAG: hypothetical protein KDA42_03350 [Planctomycetales bacterium]|nr:hypothetical protein [Planctomycetales bacterium]
MKRFLLAIALVAGVSIAMSATADTAQAAHGHGGWGIQIGNGHCGNYWGGGGYWNGPAHSWHNTSHWDYHPGGWQPHGNHFDYVPGHWDYHQTGHWDHHHW